MRRPAAALAALAILFASLSAADEVKETKKVAPVLNFKMKRLDGKEVNLSTYQGKVVLIVNVASQCGFTPQYKGLEALHEKYAKDGLAILGVPANDFGKQEPGTSAEIASFCKKNYHVKFDMLSKVPVKGKEQVPLYKYLTAKDTNPKFAGAIRWNFTKFLISRDGEIVARFEPTVTPESEEVVQAIEAQLKK
ncbi:MAG TPA: glutathione peroxidase [Gemmataceae bacterium]|jgi:glutathione peroxidase|nr:glutathione peroxidase [Gemmataceae bacterium]